MASELTLPKVKPAEVVRQVLNAIEAGRDEVLADDMTRQVKAGLSNEAGIYPNFDPEVLSQRGKPTARERETGHHFCFTKQRNRPSQTASKLVEEKSMESKMFLVTGATGDTGSMVAQFLLENGHKVRAFVHKNDERSTKLADLGAEIVIGDLLDFQAVRRALDGVSRAYFVYPIVPGLIEATAFFAQAASEAHVPHIVNMSQISARREAKSHAAFNHWIAERVFEWSGLAVTHLRPTFFAEWLLYDAPVIKAGTLASPLGPGKHAPVAAEDQARVIVGILESPAPHRGKVYPLFGPKEYTQVEIAQVLGRVLGKDVRYRQVTIEELLQQWASRGSAAPGQVNARTGYGEPEQLQRGELKESFVLQHIREVALDHQAGIFAGTNDLIETIGRRPPMSLEAFIEKHRKAFA
jgi:NAD(P)H dehydrogenase (quinone)